MLDALFLKDGVICFKREDRRLTGLDKLVNGMFLIAVLAQIVAEKVAYRLRY